MIQLPLLVLQHVVDTTTMMRMWMLLLFCCCYCTSTCALLPRLDPLPGNSGVSGGKEKISSRFGRMCTGVRLEDIDGVGLREAVREFRLIVLRDSFDPLDVDGMAKAHIRLANQLCGTAGLDTRFAPHVRASDPLIFRVSNDPSQGHTGVGISGWHCDGVFTLHPQIMQTMACVSAATGGADTSFVPFEELLDVTPKNIVRRWEQLWLNSGRGIYHPLVHTTNWGEQGDADRQRRSMFFHSGPAFVQSYKQLSTEQARRDPQHAINAADAAALDDTKNDNNDDGDEHAADCIDIDPAIIRSEIIDAIESSGLAYVHQWQPGDLLIHDNLGTAHLAMPGTQGDPNVVGLRVMERTTLRGDVPLTAAAGGALSFVDVATRLAYLQALYDSDAVQVGMSPSQQQELASEIARVEAEAAAAA